MEYILIHTSFLVLEEGKRATDYSCRVTNDLGEDERRVKAAESNLTLIAILGISPSAPPRPRHRLHLCDPSEEDEGEPCEDGKKEAEVSLSQKYQLRR